MSGTPELPAYGLNSEASDGALRSASTSPAGGNDAIELTLQTRDERGQIHTTTESVDPKKVGIIAVDCWHYHWCRTWRNRAGSLMPRFNYCFDAARKLGMTLIFSPTNATRDMHELPQRKATLALPNHPLPSLQNFQAATLGRGRGDGLIRLAVRSVSECVNVAWETRVFTTTTLTTNSRPEDDSG